MKLPVTPSFRLDNKRAIIIGSSSGIGLGCAVALADAGASVVLAARRTELLNDLKIALESKGHKAETIKLDITKIHEVEDIIRSQDSFDIMVNSSGLARHTPAVDTNEDDFNSVLDVNLKGAYFITKEIAKKLIEENKTGSLIIASILGSIAAACECEIDGNTPVKPENVLNKIDMVEKMMSYKIR